MTENESAKFKIRMDDNPESHFSDDNQELRVDKLNRRLTLITILIPCLIGAIIFLVYRDISTRVGQVSVSGTTKVQTLSKDLATRFSSLSTLQKELDNKIAALEQSSAALEEKLSTADTAIRQIRSARILDNRKFIKEIAGINQNLTALAPVPKNLENISADLKVVNDKFSKEMENYSQSLEDIKNNIIKIQADFIAMSSAKVDQKTFDLTMKKQWKAFQQLLKQNMNDIENQIASLKSNIKSNVSRVKTVKTPSDKKSPAKPAASSSKPVEAGPTPAAARPKPAPEETTAKNTTLPKPGTFIEQDIKQ